MALSNDFLDSLSAAGIDWLMLNKDFVVVKSGSKIISENEYLFKNCNHLPDLSDFTNYITLSITVSSKSYIAELIKFPENIIFGRLMTEFQIVKLSSASETYSCTANYINKAEAKLDEIRKTGVAYPDEIRTLYFDTFMAKYLHESDLSSEIFELADINVLLDRLFRKSSGHSDKYKVSVGFTSAAPTIPTYLNTKRFSIVTACLLLSHFKRAKPNSIINAESSFNEYSAAIIFTNSSISEKYAEKADELFNTAKSAAEQTGWKLEQNPAKSVSRLTIRLTMLDMVELRLRQRNSADILDYSIIDQLFGLLA